VRAEQVVDRVDRLAGRRHLERRIGEQRSYRRLDRRRLDQWFIPLNVDDDPGIDPRCNLCETVGPGTMCGRGHHRLRSSRLDDTPNPIIVRCDDDPVDPRNQTRPIDDVHNQRHPANLKQWLTRKPRRLVAGRNYCSYQLSHLNPPLSESGNHSGTNNFHFKQ